MFLMPDNRSSSTSKNSTLLCKDFDYMVNNLIRDPSLGKAERPIKKLELMPTQQASIPLGKYDQSHIPKGFCVVIDPDPEPENSVVTRVLPTGDPYKYTLTLIVANFGSRAVTVKVWRL